MRCLQAMLHHHCFQQLRIERAGRPCDWHDTQERLAGTEDRMIAALDQLGRTGLVTTIGALTAVGAAAAPAATGDTTRFAHDPQNVARYHFRTFWSGNALSCSAGGRSR